MASHAIRAQRQLHEDDRTNGEVAEVFAEGLRNRAEIQCALALLPAASQRAVKKRAQAGIDDAAQAVTLYDDLDRAPGAPYPLRAAEVRLLLSELSVQAGNVEVARRNAESALEGLSPPPQRWRCGQRPRSRPGA